MPISNQMLVEDEDLKGVVIGVMRHYLGGWPSDSDSWPIHIHVSNGVKNLLNSNELITRLQASNLSTFGLVVDADSNANGRWQWIRDFCSANGGINLPAQCPQHGLVIDGIKKRRFGAWIMPNNTDNGMLENFCHDLVPAKDKTTWDYAKSCAIAAKQLGAPFINAHEFKSQIHTWLAWQRPARGTNGNRN